MIYIVFTIATVINIFNIAITAKNAVNLVVKEKVLLITYSLAELIYIFFTLTLIEYTTANMVFVLSFIIIWLLSKAYICTLNINFEDIKEEGIRDMEENSTLDQVTNQIEYNTEECLEEENADNIQALNTEEVDNIEIIDEEPIDNLEIVNDDVEETEIISKVNPEKLELSDLVESSLNNVQRSVFTRNSLYNLSDIVETAEINKAEEKRARRRSLALRASKLMNDEQ